MRSIGLEQFLKIFQHFEKKIIRFMVIVCASLVILQLGLSRDPVQFYLAFAQKVESQPLELATLGSGQVQEQSSNQNQVSSQGQTSTQKQKVWTVKLQTQPAAPVKVYQNGKLLGTLSQGEIQLEVPAGNIQLDAREIKQSVKVRVTQVSAGLVEPKQNQEIVLRGNVGVISVKY